MVRSRQLIAPCLLLCLSHWILDGSCGVTFIPIQPKFILFHYGTLRIPVAAISSWRVIIVRSGQMFLCHKRTDSDLCTFFSTVCRTRSSDHSTHEFSPRLPALDCFYFLESAWVNTGACIKQEKIRSRPKKVASSQWPQASISSQERFRGSWIILVWIWTSCMSSFLDCFLTKSSRLSQKRISPFSYSWNLLGITD